MNKLALMAVAMLFSGMSVFAGSLPSDTTKIKTTKVSKTTKTKVTKTTAKVQYTCPMDADVITDKPGKCPKCGMTLVKKEAGKKPAMKM